MKTTLKFVFRSATFVYLLLINSALLRDLIFGDSIYLKSGDPPIQPILVTSMAIVSLT